MLLKNRKGFSLIELLVTLAIVGLVTPLIFIIFISGIEDYSTTTKYMNEQYSVMEVIRYIRQDIEEAEEITIVDDLSSTPYKVDEIKIKFPSPASSPSSQPAKVWKFGRIIDSDDGVEYEGIGFSVDGGANYKVVMRNLNVDTSDYDNCSKFEVDNLGRTDPSGNKIMPTKLILSIRPEQLNNRKFIGRNVNQNVITEFSVRYKIVKFE